MQQHRCQKTTLRKPTVIDQIEHPIIHSPSHTPRDMPEVCWSVLLEHYSVSMPRFIRLSEISVELAVPGVSGNAAGRVTGGRAHAVEADSGVAVVKEGLDVGGDF